MSGGTMQGVCERVRTATLLALREAAAREGGEPSRELVRRVALAAFAGVLDVCEFQIREAARGTTSEN